MTFPPDYENTALLGDTWLVEDLVSLARILLSLHLSDLSARVSGVIMTTHCGEAELRVQHSAR